VLIGEDNTQFPSSLTILPTYRCSAACKDCCFGSNPFVQGEISLERILAYIDEAAQISTIKLVVFSGGEPFLLGEKLDLAIRRANFHRLLTRIVTNAFWATTELAAKERLRSLKSCGLTELNISTGDYHQEFVPLKNVINAILAALSLEIPTCVVIESRLGQRFVSDILLRDERLIDASGNSRKLFRVIESPWIANYDSEKIDQQKSVLLNRHTLHLRRGCESIIQNVVVTPYEKLGACCGLPREQIPELNVGSLKEKTMAELSREACSDFLKIWLLIEGPEKILAWAASKDPSIDWENKYAHQCDACRALYNDPKVRRVIAENYEEKVGDVLLRFTLINKGKILNPAD
jgi:organic radical activating enzyme